MWAYLCTVKAFLAIFSWHILSLGLITGWLLNNGDKKQNGTEWLEDHQRVMVLVDSDFDDLPTHFNLFWSISIISIYLDYFDLFFDSGIEIAKLFWTRRPFWSGLIQDQNSQNKASQASCMLSTWLHARQPSVIPAPSCRAASGGEWNPSSFALCERKFRAERETSNFSKCPLE
jgi:hypothetical protein